MDALSLSQAPPAIAFRYDPDEDLVALLDELATACPERAEWLAMWRTRITSRSARTLELTARTVEQTGMFHMTDLAASAAGLDEHPEVIAMREETARMETEHLAQRAADEAELAAMRRRTCAVVRIMISRTRVRRCGADLPRLGRRVVRRRRRAMVRAVRARSTADPEGHGTHLLVAAGVM